MKFSKGMLAIVSGLAFSGTAAAQEPAVTATKVTPAQEAAQNVYGSADIRHLTQRFMKDDKVTNDKPLVELRPSIGTLLWDKKVDTSFNWIFTKNAGSDTLEKSSFYNVTQWKVVDGKFGYVGPYAETYFNNANFDESYVGLYGEGSADLPVTAGVVQFTYFAQPNARFTAQSSREPQAVRNETGNESFSLAGAPAGEETKTEQNDPTLVNYWGLGVKFKPAAVQGFSVGLSNEIDHEWKPKYKAVLNDSGEAVAEQDGYAVSELTINKFTLSYALNDKVTVTNQVRHYMDGIYEAGMDGRRFENRLILSATLF